MAFYAIQLGGPILQLPSPVWECWHQWQIADA